MASQVVQNGPINSLPSFNWLNAGIIHLDQEGWLTVHNELAVTLLDIDVQIGTPVRLDETLSPYREEYKLLHHIVSSQVEVRNQLITWAENGQIRHVLIDSYLDTSVMAGVASSEALKSQSSQPANASMSKGSAWGSLGMYVMLKDLGDFVLLDQHLQRTDKLAVVGKVAAGVAHEIRNPLTTVRGFLQVMKTRMESREMDEEEAYLDMMVAEVDKVESLVKELLLLSKPHRMVHGPCEFGQLVEAVQPKIEVTAKEKMIRSEFLIGDNLPAVYGDKELLTHVILQLTENALDAMEPDGLLTVKVSSEDSLIRLDVHDTGPGIPYYQMDQVFDAFFTTKDKGTGLGLPICKKIVADHRGEIYVSSKGFGTTFSVVLPATRDAV